MSRQNLIDAVKPLVTADVRARIVRGRFASRRPTSGLRLLPDFLLLGTMRGGTSSLYKYLSQHADVAPSLRKEIEYFTRNYDAGEAWYRQHFALQATRRMAELRGRTLKAFEATPYYLYEPRCPQRVAALLPTSKLLVVLRDPVERAFSHYEHMVRHGHETLSFAEAVAAEPDRIGGEIERLLSDPEYQSRIHHRYSYVDRGRYAAQLERWLSHFPRDQFLIVDSHDLFSKPRETFSEILEFLGLTPWSPEEFRNYSYVGVTPKRGAVDQSLRRELEEVYAEPDAKLAGLWGRTPSWRV